jgi:hypothetical protein
VFTQTYAPGERVPLPVAHAEGRFTARQEAAWSRWQERGQIPLRYTNPPGTPATAPTVFPWNPNGASLDAAAVSNREGNVLAIMPHPERAEALFQVPIDLSGSWGERRRRSAAAHELRQLSGPGRGIFLSLALELGVKTAKNLLEGERDATCSNFSS